MIIGKVIKVKVNYGWIISEPDIMYPLRLVLRRSSRNIPVCRIPVRRRKGIGYHWLSIMEKPLKVEVMSMLFFRRQVQAFAKKPAYKVLQQDRNAHIVQSLSDNIYSYVLFETPQALLPGGLLQRTDTSCLVMIRKESPEKMLLTVSQPDLALYRGASDEAFDKDGKRVERSIYSRPWIDNESGEIPVTVTLKGQWNIKETPFCKVLSVDKKQTVLRFTCKDGASLEVMLEKR